MKISKRLSLHSITFSFSAIIFLLFASLSNSCRKDTHLDMKQLSEQLPVEKQNIKILTELTTQLLSLTQNKSFTTLVIDECKKQKYGDYYVRLEEFFNNIKVRDVIPLKTTNAVLDLLIQLKRNDFRNPILFYPKVETMGDKKLSLSFRDVAGDNNDYLAVINDGSTDGGLKDEYPGYRYNINGGLDYVQQVNEEFAWNNDVWVIGQEENCSEGNMIAASEDLNTAHRYQGQSEWAGIIQVTDIGAIESWISGKLEFKMTIMNSSGTIVSGPRAFGKWARKNFQNNNWKNFDHFVGYWNTSTFGNWMYENWMEEDGGSSNSTSISMPPPSGYTGPTITTTIPSRNLDDDLGLATIQFTDPISTVYNISYANIKRSN